MSQGADAVIDGGAGDDTIVALHPGITSDFIGDDQITSSIISGGDGDDIIHASDATIDGGAGDNYIGM